MGRLKLAFEFRKQSESSAAHLRSFISKVNKQFTQVTTVRDNDNDDEVDMEEYLFDGEFGEQPQDESTVLQTSTTLKELDVEEAEIVHKIKAENVESETIEEVIFENNEDEAVENNSNEDVEQMEEVIMEAEVYEEEEHLLDDVYLEEQVNLIETFLRFPFEIQFNIFRNKSLTLLHLRNVGKRILWFYIIVDVVTKILVLKQIYFVTYKLMMESNLTNVTFVVLVLRKMDH